MSSKERIRNPVFDMAPFALPSSFWSPSYVRGSPWLEHLPFCFWAVEAARPASVVVAGALDGVAYFSLCQAVSRLGLDARCLLLFADEEPPSELLAHNSEHFAAFSRIETGDRAVDRLAAGSIDLLVLSATDLGAGQRGGLSEQLDAWLPKLSSRAVVLVPGIGAESAHGAIEDWNTIAKQRPHFSFQHGGGLGVAGVGAALPELLAHLFTLPDGRHSGLVRAMFSRLGRAVAEGHRHAVVKGRLQRSDARGAELDLELRRKARRLTLASEHAERVAAAMGVLKRDQDETSARLANALDKLGLLEADRNALDRARKRDQERIRGIKGELAGLRRQLERERASHRRMTAELEASLQEILASRSWAVTAPLRRMARWMSRLR